MNGVDFGKRFGTVAVEKGFVTQEQVMEALDIQVRENIRENRHRYIGGIMKDLGHMKMAQINEVLSSLFSPL